MTDQTGFQSLIESPLGGVLVTANRRGAVASVVFVDDEIAEGEPSDAAIAAAQQLEEYFAGTRREFDLVLSPDGTDFEKRVWKELVNIPFGATDTYGAIAARLGDPGASRAVGVANARNPIAVIVPCHRVIGADGNLTGYAGGLWRKKWLLAHEVGQQPFDFAER